MRFDRISGQIRNLANGPVALRKKVATCTATARFQGSTPLKALFRFNLARHRQGAFSLDLDVGSFDGATVNSFAEPLGLMTLKSGKAHLLKARLRGDNRTGSGKLLLLYDDLHVTALKKDEEGELKKKRLFSKLANAFVLKDHNPSGDDPPRSPDCFYQKQPGGTFF